MDIYEGQVIGIQATGAHSAISGVTAVGPQTMPYGYDLLGDKYGVVAKTLLPGEVFHSEPGAMVFMSDGVAMSAKFGGGFRGTASQVFSGESFAKVEYTNRAGAPGYIGLTSNQPFSSVIPVQLAALPGGSINVKRGAYMAGTPDVTARMKYLPAKDCTACCEPPPPPPPGPRQDATLRRRMPSSTRSRGLDPSAATSSRGTPRWTAWNWHCGH